MLKQLLKPLGLAGLLGTAALFASTASAQWFDETEYGEEDGLFAEGYYEDDEYADEFFYDEYGEVYYDTEVYEEPYEFGYADYDDYSDYYEAYDDDEWFDWF